VSLFARYKTVISHNQSVLWVFLGLGLEGQVLGLGLVPKSLFQSLLHGILFLSVALSTVERQCSREAAFFHVWEVPMFSGLSSNSMALSHVWLGLPGGRFQSDGGLQIAAVTAR